LLVVGLKTVSNTFTQINYSKGSRSAEVPAAKHAADPSPWKFSPVK